MRLPFRSETLKLVKHPSWRFRIILFMIKGCEKYTLSLISHWLRHEFKLVILETPQTVQQQ